VEATRVDQVNRQAWALAVVAVFLFVLGGVTNWAQELWVWIPRRVASIGIVLGLGCSFGALVQVTWALFGGVALLRRQHWNILWATLMAALPPLAFVVWIIWMRW